MMRELVAEAVSVISCTFEGFLGVSVATAKRGLEGNGIGATAAKSGEGEEAVREVQKGEGGPARATVEKSEATAAIVITATRVIVAEDGRTGTRSGASAIRNTGVVMIM